MSFEEKLTGFLVEYGLQIHSCKLNSFGPHTQSIDGAVQVDAEAAKDFARRAATEEGLLVGISSGATLAAIAAKLPDLPAGSRVLGFAYDTGERYLSVPDFLPEA